MKDLATGVASFLRITDQSDEILAPVAVNLFKRVMGDVTRQLFPVRYCKGTLFLRAANEGWLREGKRRSKMISSTINNTVGCEIIKKVVLEKGELPEERHDVQLAKEEKASTATPKELIDAAASIDDARLREAFLDLVRIVSNTRASKQFEN